MAIISPTMAPIVNLNGTPKSDLLNARVNAWNALSSAIDAMYPLLPHGRDYIPNPALMAQDRDIHFARLALLDGMRNALLDEYKTLTKEA